MPDFRIGDRVRMKDDPQETGRVWAVYDSTPLHPIDGSLVIKYDDGEVSDELAACDFEHAPEFSHEEDVRALGVDPSDPGTVGLREWLA